MYEFSSAMSQHPKRNVMDVAVYEGEILGIYTYSFDNYNANTQTFYVRSGNTYSSRYDAEAVLAWYKRRDSSSTSLNNLRNIPSPRIITTDAL